MPLPARPAPPALPEPNDPEPVVQAKMAAALRFYQQAYQNDTALIQSLDSERRAWFAAYGASQRAVELLAKATDKGEEVGDRCAALRATYEQALNTAEREMSRQRVEIERLRGQRNSTFWKTALGSGLVFGFGGYKVGEGSCGN